MSGLLLKELYMARKYCRLHLVITVLFLGMAMLPSAENLFLLFYPSAMASFIPVTLLSYDTQSKWDVYFDTLPTSRAQYVSAKYLIGLILGELVLALTAVTQLLAIRLNGEIGLNQLLPLLWGLQAITLVLPTLYLPPIFKLGVEKGRIWSLVMIAVNFGGGSRLTVGVKDWGSFSLPGNFTAWLLLGAVVLYALSWLLSIRLYRSREL